MHRTTVWLTHEDEGLLREIAWRERRTMSDVIREGIRLVADTSRIRHPATTRDPDDIVSSRVSTRPTQAGFLTPTEGAVLSLRNGRLSPDAIARDLDLTEEEVLIVFDRIDAKMEAWVRGDDPADPVSSRPT